MRKFYLWFIGFFLACGLLGGCAPIAAPATPTPSPSPAPTKIAATLAQPATSTPQNTKPPVPSRTPVLQDHEQDPILVFTYSGGIMGMNQRWEIFRDGLVVLNHENRYQADRAELTRLLDEVTCEEFPARPLQQSRTCADCFTATLERYEQDNLCAFAVVLEMAPENSTEKRLAQRVLDFVNSLARD